ncbi:MAG: cryptochrome/photolyase family protein [Halobacteriales archaeon]
MTVLVLGDQLVRGAGPLASRPDDRALLIEATAFARRLPYHPHKLTLVFSAMAHAREELRNAGRPVDYRRVETFEAGIREHFADHPGDELHVMRPASHGAVERLETLISRHGGSLVVHDNAKFLMSPEAFDEWAGEDLPRHEDFYRHVRRETGYLMADGDPVGGEWNLDEQNRKPVPADYDPPEPPRFEPDDLTRETSRRVRETFDGGYATPPYGGGWADPDPFRWPVTREEGLAALEDFVTHRLAAFGPYQDALADDRWANHHSLLAVSLNLGLLRPGEVVARAIAAGTDDSDVPLSSLEGFVRQVIGWREFVRHAYRRRMPALADANQLGADRPLPSLYWTGETEMRCLDRAVEGVRRRGYAHHIQRLMVMSNFALLYGADPAAVNRWFHAGFVDAFHWVTAPNVLSMGLYADDALATKPYAASANYVDRMGDHCAGCPYDPDETLGADACPFNALYWDFLDRNEDRLRSNHRMALVYAHLDDKDREAMRERAADVRRGVAAGEL